MFKPRNAKTLSLCIATVGLALIATSCSAVKDLAEDKTGETINIPDFTTPDFDAPDFTVPDLVAPDIEVPTIEAPELPEIRFPDANEIDIPEIKNPDIGVAETGDETIYTIKGQVLFDFDQAQLRPEAQAALDEILSAIESRGFEGSIEVAGHSDAVGAADYNQDLSVRRATGVALKLVEKLGADRKIQAVGYGESQPIARNTNEDGSDNEVGRAQNRRVEIIVGK